ncbi:hypothetical protein VII_002465 [Vibrio mimicus MB451]|nr:hypothetical protein VII_002465 [Vibrio mimicus MB451]
MIKENLRIGFLIIILKNTVYTFYQTQIEIPLSPLLIRCKRYHALFIEFDCNDTE